MTKDERIQAIEKIITSMKWVKEDDYEEDNYHRLATAIEEAIGVSTKDVADIISSRYSLSFCSHNIDGLAKAISTNEKVITINENTN